MSKLARLLPALAIALLLLVGVFLGPVDAQNVSCYREQGGAKVVASSGCEYEFRSGSTLDLQNGASFSLGTGLYPVGAITQSQQIYCSTAGFTGTTTILLASHGVNTPTAAVATLATAPAVSAGDPFLVTAAITAATSTVGIETWQDDATVATKTATVNYCIYGSD